MRTTTNTRVRYFGIWRGRPRVDSDTPRTPRLPPRHQHLVLRRLESSILERNPRIEQGKKKKELAAVSRRALAEPFFGAPIPLCASYPRRSGVGREGQSEAMDGPRPPRPPRPRPVAVLERMMLATDPLFNLHPSLSHESSGNCSRALNACMRTRPSPDRAYPE